MLFTSYNFLLFATIVGVLYYLLPKKEKTQWVLLLLASYAFYCFSGPKYIIYIVATTISSYLISLKLHRLSEIQTAYLKEHKAELTKEEKKSYKAGIKKKRWHWLLSCLFLNFGILAVVKYGNFTIANINGIMHTFGSDRTLSFMKLALPLGISFYTFMTMGYMIDVYREKYEPQKNPFKLALLVSYFPQLVQGPIGKFDEMAETFFTPHRFDKERVASGLQRVLWGYFKKMVVADRIIVAVKEIIGNPESYQGAYVFVGMMFYAFELYCDFTGGIDITIGFSEALGIRLTENFNRPYFSKSIKEYWRRWHISLGVWFTEYIFYPISVCKPMLKFSKFTRAHFGEHMGKRVPVYVATIAVWFVTGIWHGAAWNFIVWGLMNCLFLMLAEEMEPFYAWFHSKFHVEGKKWFRNFRIIRTVLLMSSLRAFDCYRDVPLTFKMWFSMFHVFNWSELLHGSLMKLGLSMTDYVVLMIALIIIFTVSVIGRYGSVRKRIRQLPFYFRFVIWYGLFLLVLLWGAYGIGFDASQFIYNQF